jgi:gluconolactonase
MKKMLLIIFTLSHLLINGQNITIKNTNFKVEATNLSFPEGIIYDYSNTIYFSNCYGNWLGKLTASGLDTLAIKSTNPVNFGKTNGLAIYTDNNIYACDYGMGAILKIYSNGICDTFLTGYKGQKFNRPNDIAFTPEGNMYFTDPKSYDKNNLDGVIYFVNMKTKEIKPAFSGLGFPNGIAIGPCKKYLYVSESAKNRVLRFKICEDGTLSDSTEIVHLPGGDPDGLAFDSMGNLYIAHFGGGKIVIVSPNNEIIKTIDTPGKKPSNLEFAGEDLKTLYITEDENNCIYSFKNDIPGLKLFSSPASTKKD